MANKTTTKYRHTINGLDKQGNPFTIQLHDNNPLTIRRTVIMYFTKHCYVLLNASRCNVNVEVN